MIVQTELGPEMGRVLSLSNILDSEAVTLKSIISLASEDDLLLAPTQERRDSALKIGRELIKSYDLKMKLVGCFISLSGDRYNFAFVAEGRVDFRDLARALASRLGGNIRLTQIGIRDEARLCGSCGACSRELCCQKVLKNLCPITSDMADIQQTSHRNSDRLVGVCGRLKCCLSYEYEGYKELNKQLPPTK